MNNNEIMIRHILETDDLQVLTKEQTDSLIHKLEGDDNNHNATFLNLYDSVVYFTELPLYNINKYFVYYDEETSEVVMCNILANNVFEIIKTVYINPYEFEYSKMKEYLKEV